MGPTWGPPGDDRTQVGPMLAPWNAMVPFSQAQSLWVPPIINNAFRCYRRELWRWRLDSANCIEFENIFYWYQQFIQNFHNPSGVYFGQATATLYRKSLTLCVARITPDDICLYSVCTFDLNACTYSSSQTIQNMKDCPMNICRNLKS